MNWEEMWALAHRCHNTSGIADDLQAALCELLKDYSETVYGEWGVDPLDDIPKKERENCGH